MSQSQSLVDILPKRKRYALYENITEDNLKNYHSISCRPINKRAEDEMELVSDIVTWGERYLNHWSLTGIYRCSRCSSPLYSVKDKYKGPCVWPSFRQAISESSISTTLVKAYNNYKVAVLEVYCGKCNLFIGHQFEDAKEKGDTHPLAHWRH